MRRMASEIRVQVKDGLRGLRYVIRHEARDPALPLLPGVLRRAGLPGNPIARLADEMFSQAESVARVFDPTRLLPPELAPPIGVHAGAGGFPLPVEAFVAGSADDGRQRFAAACYRGLKDILAASRADNVLISEAAVEAAHDGLLRRHGALVHAAAAPSATDARLGLAAAIAVELEQAAPVLRADGFAGLPEGCDVNRFAALVVGLATAVVSLPEGAGEDRGAVLASAADTVAVRAGPLSAALDDAAPVSALAGVFAGLAPYLP